MVSHEIVPSQGEGTIIEALDDARYHVVVFFSVKAEFLSQADGQGRGWKGFRVAFSPLGTSILPITARLVGLGRS